MVGFEVDLVNAVAANLNLTVEWHPMMFADIQAAVMDRSVDLGVCGYSITSSRLNEVSFTIPHSSVFRQVLMTPGRMAVLNISSISSLADLKSLNLTIGAQMGATELDELVSAGVNYRSFIDLWDAFGNLTSDNPTLDAVYAETPLTPIMVQYEAEGKPMTVVYSAPYYPCAFMTNLNAQTFTAKINGALADIIASGQMDPVKAKWNLTDSAASNGIGIG